MNTRVAIDSHTGIYKGHGILRYQINYQNTLKSKYVQKYHTHTLQMTNPRHSEKGSPNTNSLKTSGRELKQSNTLSLPRQDDCKSRQDTDQCITKHRPTQNPHKQCELKQWIDNNRTTALEQTAA